MHIAIFLFVIFGYHVALYTDYIEIIEQCIKHHTVTDTQHLTKIQGK